MKKLSLTFVFLLIISFSFCMAYTENFDFMIDTMGISTTNVHGKELNEEIYNCYSLFVYGSPLEMTEGQRFKEVADGRWQKGGSSYKGDGIRGEYWILRRKQRWL